IQGLTLGPLLRRLDLHDDDPIGHEVAAARARALSAALAALDADRSPSADAAREEFLAHLESRDADGRESSRAVHIGARPPALQAARRERYAMRASDDIGDDAFHQIEEELDWIDMAEGQED